MNYATWNDVVGHEDVKNLLRSMVLADRTPHALLFTGPEGVGKQMTALILAAALLCEDAPDKRPCGECVPCRQISQDANPDFTLIRPDGATVKIDQIRALQRKLALASYGGRRRVAVIDDADAMTPPAAGSLLKVLEEPSGDTVFVLVASRPGQLLATVRSRCFTVRFFALAAGLIARTLQNTGGGRAGEAVARLSDGRYAEALRLAAPGGLELRDRAAQLILRLPDGGMDLVWETAEMLADKNQALDANEFLRFLACILRDMLLAGDPATEPLILNSDIQPQLTAAAGRWRESALCRSLGEVRRTRTALDANANPRLAFEALLIKLADLAKEE